MNFIEQGNDGFEADTTPTEDVHIDDEVRCLHCLTCLIITVHL